jgi:hypothetical protein
MSLAMSLEIGYRNESDQTFGGVNFYCFYAIASPEDQLTLMKVTKLSDIVRKISNCLQHSSKMLIFFVFFATARRSADTNLKSL